MSSLINLQGNFTGDMPELDEMVNPFLVMFDAPPGSNLYFLVVDLLNELIIIYDDAEIDIVTRGEMFGARVEGLDFEGFLILVCFLSLTRSVYGIFWG